MTAEQPIPDAQWQRAVLIALAFHATAIAYLLARPSAPVARQSEMAPFAVELSEPSPPPPAPPSDLSVDQTRAEIVPQPVRAPPPIADLVATSHGTIAETRPSPRVVTPTAPALAPAKAAAAPPMAPAAPSRLSTARVFGASSSTASAVPTWEAEVRARLERAKRYPAGARIMKQQDTVTVVFHVDGSGRVSGGRIKRSSGFEELEGESLSLIARVSPLPPPPGGAARDFSVPIQFHIDP